MFIQIGVKIAFLCGGVIIAKHIYPAGIDGLYTLLLPIVILVAISSCTK